MTPEDVLRQAVDGDKLVVFVGAGVSIAATRGSASSECASWSGLLEHGFRYCVETLGASAAWEKLRRDQLELGEHVSAAELLTERLSVQMGGWLTNTVGRLVAEETTLLDALVALRAPLVTTNYDDTLRKAAKADVVTWREHGRLSAFLHDLPKDRVLHLHGHWEDPESVVLGMRSYDRILRDAAAQTALRALFATRVVLFVGYGAGLADPNFDALRRWMRVALREDRTNHWVLVPSDGLAQARVDFNVGGKILPISYGSHADLPEFLRRIAPQVLEASTTPTTHATANAVVHPTESCDLAKALPAYLEAVIREHAATKLLGFGVTLNAPVRLEDLYVPLSVTPEMRRVLDAKPGGSAEAEELLRHEIDPGRDTFPLTRAFV